tara:strand:+ start:27504 stop:28109 length:606 start_codon:yes stop_codon:yes gene_type:complete
MTKLPKRSKTFGVGKEIGGAVYVHRSYMDVLPGIVSECVELLEPETVFSVVKYAEKAKTVTFIDSPNFDEASEPVIGDLTTITFGGKATRRKRLSDPYIYHHKWLFVKDDYTGFDVEESKQHSLTWLSLDGIDKKRIGRRSYWRTHVMPRLSAGKDRWLNSTEMASRLNVSACELSHLRIAGKLPFKKHGNAYLYLVDEVK